MDDLEVELPNGSCGDTLVLARLRHSGTVLLFDAGDARHLDRRDLLRLSHVFVSHCHVDHFIGFDALVRPRVCRDDRLVAHGPPGFLDRVEARLSGYTWNLTEGNRFELLAREVMAQRVKSARFASADEFRREDLPDEPRQAIVHAGPEFSVESEALDHHVISQGWAVQAPARASVDVAALAATGLPAGPWLGELKQAVDRGLPPRTPFPLPDGRVVPLGQLRDDLLRVRRGSRVAFVTDTTCDGRTRPRIVLLARAADVFACESAFLHADLERAVATRHLTARQAGEMAREAGVRRLLLFHVSERYGGETGRHLDEAAAAAGPGVEVVVVDGPGRNGPGRS